MADIFSKKKRSWLMSRVKGKNTKIEKILEHDMKKHKVNFKKHPKIHGNPDFLVNGKMAVFVDGCFWHKCPKHFTEPKSRREFWIPKIEKNVSRDRDVSRRLRKDGYRVLRFWEHDLKKHPGKCIEKILYELDKY